MQDEVYEDEIEFDDPPIIDEIPSDDIEKVDNAFASTSTSEKTCRGKGLLWVEHVLLHNGDTVVYSTLAEVEEDVINSKYSKMCSSPPHLQYRCKTKNCNYKRKYLFSDFYDGYISLFSGDHHHGDDEVVEIGQIQRGITEAQKIIVKDAFRAKLQSSAEIVNYFRHRRKLNNEAISQAEFPTDPDIKKLNNFIATYKKSNACVYNPSLSDLVTWCEAHGPQTVDEKNMESFNTPFVLDYFLVN